jgi:hypothetical protein
MARWEWDASVTGLSVLQARAAADAGALALLREGVQRWDTLAGADSTPIVAGALGDHTFRGNARRLSREFWLAEARGRVRGALWDVAEQRLVWVLDPLGRIAAARGGVEVADSRIPERSLAMDPDRPPFCDGWWPALDSVASSAVWGAVSGVAPAPTGEPSLGLLGPRDLAASLPRLEGSSGTPEPTHSLGRCEPDLAWNWGDPRTPEGPCAGRLASWFAPADLRLEGGAGQGFLVVAGDLEVVGTRFDGVLLVGGRLTLRVGADVRGYARSGIGFDVEEGSRFTGSPCRAIRVLDHVRGRLTRPVPFAPAGILAGSG